MLGFEAILWHWLGNGVILLLTFSAGCLVVGFHWQARLKPQWALPSTAAFRSFGRLSYEIYLTHMFVVLTLVRIYRWSGTGVRWLSLVPAGLRAGMGSRVAGREILLRPLRARPAATPVEVAAQIGLTPAAFRVSLGPHGKGG